MKFPFGHNLDRFVMKPVLFWLVLFFPLLVNAQAQKEKPTVVAEQIYDEPYSINKLFVGFQPLYGEVFATNVNSGFGIEASYYQKDKFDVKANFRKTYSAEFFDYNRNASLKDQVNYAGVNGAVSDKPQSFIYYELGGTYHIKDFDQESKTKMALYKKTFKGDRWAAMVPLQAEISCKVRKIYGARLGMIAWSSTTDLSRAMVKQNLTNADLKTSAGKSLVTTYPYFGQTRNLNVFGNIQATNLYVGGSMTWIRNVAASFDKYDDSVDDGIMTVFLDLIVAPQLSLSDVTYQGEQYSTKAIKTNAIGFRAGIDGKFNRTLGWSYGGEIGSRPSVKGMGFYALLKISFPLFGTDLNNKVETFSK